MSFLVKINSLILESVLVIKIIKHIHSIKNDRRSNDQYLKIKLKGYLSQIDVSNFLNPTHKQSFNKSVKKTITSIIFTQLYKQKSIGLVITALFGLFISSSAYAASVTTYTDAATYTAAENLINGPTTFEDFSAVTTNYLASTSAATPDVWNGVNISAFGTPSGFGSSGYCPQLIDPYFSTPTNCLGYNPNAPSVPGMVGSMSPTGGVNFQFPSLVVGVNFEYVDWNDDNRQRSNFTVNFSDGTSLNVNGPTHPINAPAAFFGAILDTASIEQGITIVNIQWNGLPGEDELVGFWNYGTKSVYHSDLQTIKTLASGDPTPAVGDTVTFDITVTNNGPDQATNVSLSDSLPSGLTATGNNGNVSTGTYTAGIWNVGTLANGASATLTIEGIVDAVQTGNTITNTTTAASSPDVVDPIPTGDDLEETVTVPIVVDLNITKTVDDSTPNIGDTVTFSLAVENLGPNAATAVTVTDVVPAGFTYVAGSMTGISPTVVGITADESSPAGTGLNWTITSLTVAPAAGSSTTLTFEAVVNAP